MLNLRLQRNGKFLTFPAPFLKKMHKITKSEQLLNILHAEIEESALFITYFK